MAGLSLLLLSLPSLVLAAPSPLPGLGAAAPAPSTAAAPSSPPSRKAGQQALRLLEQASVDDDPELRALAASAWGQIGNPAAHPLLSRALKDRNVYVRIEAATALQKVGFRDEAFAALMGIIQDAPKPGKTPAQVMRDLARNKARVLAIERLADFGGEDAVKLFEKTLKDPSDAVRDATAIALARMGLEEFSQGFVDALKSQDEGVRAAAARSLGLIGGEVVPPALQAAASDKSVSVRVEVMRAMAGFKGSDAAAILARGLSDRDDRVKFRALASLAKLSDAGSLALLRKIGANKPTAELELEVLAGLARRGDKVQFDVVNDALHEKDADLRALAFDVLRAVDDDRSLPLLEDVLAHDPDPRLRVQAAALIIQRLSGRRGG